MKYDKVRSHENIAGRHLKYRGPPLAFIVIDEQ